MESHRFRFQVSRLPSDQALGQTNIWLQQCACLCSFMFIVLARLSHQRMSKFGNVEEIILKALRLLRSASEAHKECSTKPRSCVFCINVASWFVSIPSHWALSTHDMTWYPTNVERISIFQGQWHHNPSTISSSFKHSQIDARCVAILSVSLMGCPEWANRFAAGWSHPVFCLATAAVQAPTDNTKIVRFVMACSDSERAVASPLATWSGQLCIGIETEKIPLGIEHP